MVRIDFAFFPKEERRNGNGVIFAPLKPYQDGVCRGCGKYGATEQAQEDVLDGALPKVAVGCHKSEECEVAAGNIALALAARVSAQVHRPLAGLLGL